MKAKPIEPGCLAMVVGMRFTPENNGRVVRVVRVCERGYSNPGSGSGRTRVSADKEGWVCVVLPSAPPLTVATMRGKPRCL